MKIIIGSYILVIQVQQDITLRVGKIGILHFKRGYYAYIGSALSGLSTRLKRHLRREKKIHWHIDYLLAKAKIKEIWYSEEKAECTVAHSLSAFTPIPHFGCSDCACTSHLFYSSTYPELTEAITRLGMKRYEHWRT